MFPLTALELRLSTTWGLDTLLVAMVVAAVVVVVVVAAVVVVVAVVAVAARVLTVMAGDNVGTTNDNKRDNETQYYFHQYL